MENTLGSTINGFQNLGQSPEIPDCSTNTK